MPDPLITIGITCFREGEWLRECWESVLAQDDDRWVAVLVMDGGADEATRRIFEALESPRIVAKYAFDRNVGPYAVRNKAFELSPTPYHFYLDADDALCPWSVRLALEGFRRTPEPACVYGDLEWLGGAADVVRYPRSPTLRDWVRAQCAPGAAAYSVRAWREVGRFYEGPLAGGDADHDFHLSLVERGLPHHHCGTVLYRYRRHHSGRVSTAGWEEMYRTRLVEAERHPRIFSDPALLATFLTDGFHRAIVERFRRDEFDEGRALARTFFAAGRCDKRMLHRFTYGRARAIAVLPRPAARVVWRATRGLYRLLRTPAASRARLLFRPAEILRRVRGRIALRRGLASMAADCAAGRTVVAVDMATRSFVQFVRPILDEMRKRSDRLSFYVVSSHPMPDAAEALGIPPDRCLPASYSTRLVHVRAYLKPAMVVAAAPPQALSIYVGHGFGAKFNAWEDRFFRDIDHYFVTGPIHHEMLLRLRKERPHALGHLRFHPVGHPKNDDLFDGRYRRDDVLRGLGLDPDRFTVLYAPSWDAGGALRTHGTKPVELLLGLTDVNVIVKLHQVSLERPDSPHYVTFTGGVDWRSRFAPLYARPRFRFIEEHFINPYLVASDLLVTDFSGVAWTFMLLDRPVMYIHCPEYFEKTLPLQGQDPGATLHDEGLNAGRHVGYLVEDVDRLPDAIAYLRAHPEYRAEERRALVRRLLYNPGRGAATAAETILDLIEKGERRRPVG